MHQFAGWSKWLKRGFGNPRRFFLLSRQSFLCGCQYNHPPPQFTSVSGAFSPSLQSSFHRSNSLLLHYRFHARYSTLAKDTPCANRIRTVFPNNSTPCFSFWAHQTLFFSSSSSSIHERERERRRKEKMMLMRQKKQRRNSKTITNTHTQTSVCAFLGVKSRSRSRERIWEMLMHFISSPTRKKTKTKTTEIRERESFLICPTKRVHREVLFRSVSVLPNASSRFRERGLSPSLAVSFSGNSAVFRCHRRLDPPFWSTLLVFSVFRCKFESFFHANHLFLLVWPLYKRHKTSTQIPFSKCSFGKDTLRHSTNNSSCVSNSVFGVSNSVFRIENEEKEEVKKQGVGRPSLLLSLFFSSSFPSSDREPKVRNSMRDFVFPCFTCFLAFHPFFWRMKLPKTHFPLSFWRKWPFSWETRAEWEERESPVIPLAVTLTIVVTFFCLRWVICLSLAGECAKLCSNFAFFWVLFFKGVTCRGSIWQFSWHAENRPEGHTHIRNPKKVRTRTHNRTEEQNGIESWE